ncbi:transglutaminase-like domain-containing protein [Novipirellula artificiosorum]|uniref:Transglutaminase-like superfamily protein n=1 Tax=Novipirellula artificiosorum TaxID=2528016 RepID=A0A5C6DIW0_9BACT|nr:transglutaminase-like domain-containing protein [Novipirellula artificiosorum]TWU37323.1 Transglutaminase-like superfamily protein [Novipirellula artificiosorum]
MPILAITAVVFAGDVRVGAQGRLIYQLISLALVLLSIGFFFSCRSVDGKASPSFSPKHKWLLLTIDSDEDLSQQADAMTSEDWARLIALPHDLDPRIGELAARVIGKSVTTGDKILAVENFFLDNYEYQFGIEVPAQRDPIAYFLLDRPPAHCEYFASGAVVLLRSVGVPCRYVTGLVAGAFAVRRIRRWRFIGYRKAV